jgi:hypothetical protein
VAICHCTDCQTLSGAPFRASVIVAADKLRLLSGEPSTYVKTAESGNKRAKPSPLEGEGGPSRQRGVGRGGGLRWATFARSTNSPSRHLPWRERVTLRVRSNHLSPPPDPPLQSPHRPSPRVRVDRSFTGRAGSPRRRGVPSCAVPVGSDTPPDRH